MNIRTRLGAIALLTAGAVTAMVTIGSLPASAPVATAAPVAATRTANAAPVAAAAAGTSLLAAEGELGEHVLNGHFVANGPDPVTYNGARLARGIDELTVVGSNFRDVLFQPARDDDRNVAGLFEGVRRAEDGKPNGQPGLYYFGAGIGCYTVSGRYRIDQVERDASGNLTAFAARFEQVCGNLERVPPTVSLFGSVAFHATVPVYVHQLSALSINFAATAPGATSAPGTLTITNRSPQGLPYTSVALTGTDAGDFTITGNDCPATIPVAASCTVTVVYHPSSTKATVDARLNVQDAFTSWGGTAPVGEDVVLTVGGASPPSTPPVTPPSTPPPGTPIGGTPLTAPPVGGEMHPLPPARILDTRTGQGLDGGVPRPVGDRETITFAVAGRGGVPATGASAVMVNVTATNSKQSGWLALFPSGTDWPGSSTLNFKAGDDAPNLAVSALGSDGRLALRNCCGTTDAVVDVVGWFGTASGASALGFYPLAPRRLVDTRESHTPLPADTTRVVPVRGLKDVPADASAVVINLTATEPTAGTFVTAYPSDVSPRPEASNLNLVAGETRPNLVTVKLAADGSIALYNHTGSVHLVIDIVGYFGTSRAASGRFTTATPRRVLDTREGSGKIPPLGTVTADFRGDDGARHVEAVVLNVTVTDATTASYLSAYPSGGALPDSSNLNFVAGQTIANLVVVPVGADGKVAFFNHAGATNLVVDLVGVVAL